MTDNSGRRALLAAVLVTASGLSHGADVDQQTSAATPLDPPGVVDPAAIEALEAMSTHLRSLKHFAIDARVSKDKVISGGGKLQFDHELKVSFVHGRGLFMDSSSPRRHLQYFYDRKHFTLYSPGTQYYATVDAPDTVGATMGALDDQYGVSLPLSDIFYWGTEKQPTDGIEGAIVVGAGRVDGQDCRHYAYRQAAVDWQLCIAEGDQPLPLKLVITTTDIVEQPQYAARMKWDLNPTVEADSFTFVAPQGAMKIEFSPLTTQQ